MLLPLNYVRRRLAALGIVVFLGGCGGHAHRPASTLSDQDRAVLAAYEQLRAGLAGDDPRKAKRGAAALVAQLQKGLPDRSAANLLDEAQAVANAKALDSARELFQPLSASLVPLAAGVDGYYIMTSPPGFGGKWIQQTPDVDNPYLGQVMHSTGSLEK